MDSPPELLPLRPPIKAPDGSIVFPEEKQWNMWVGSLIILLEYIGDQHKTCGKEVNHSETEVLDAGVQ